MLWLFGGLLACTTKNDEVKGFIPGTYVRYSENEMGRRYDTLQIEILSACSNNYRVIRFSSVQRLLDGQAFPWERRREVWACVYDEDKQIMNEMKKGKVMSFVPERSLLLVGSTEYKKIK